MAVYRLYGNCRKISTLQNFLKGMLRMIVSPFLTMTGGYILTFSLYRCLSGLCYGQATSCTTSSKTSRTMKTESTGTRLIKCKARE